MRAFLAIELPDQLKNELHEYRNLFRENAMKGRWRHSDNFHLTLKFFDQLSDRQWFELDGLLGEACSKLRPFCLLADEAGIFAGKGCNKDICKDIRTLWMGIGGDMKALYKLYEVTEASSEAVGFARERRRFSPHITLGQEIKLEKDFEELKAELDRPDFAEIPVVSLFLFKSEQLAGKRVYTKISEYKLAGAKQKRG